MLTLSKLPGVCCIAPVSNIFLYPPLIPWFKSSCSADDDDDDVGVEASAVPPSPPYNRVYKFIIPRIPWS